MKTSPDTKPKSLELPIFLNQIPSSLDPLTYLNSLFAALKCNSLWILHEPREQACCIDDIWPCCCQIQEATNEASINRTINFACSIFLDHIFILNQWSADWFTVFHAEFVQNLICLFSLTNKDSLLVLKNLHSKEIRYFPHVCYLKKLSAFHF